MASIWMTIALILVSGLEIASVLAKHRGRLSMHYYAQTCPSVEDIIAASTQQKLAEAPTTAAAVVRLFFHDCFIEGCDASIMVTSTGDNVAERDAPVNKDLAGDAFDAVIRAKKAVEEQCPGVVSCADVLAIATRDFIVLTGGPKFPVRKGRKDGLISMASRVGDNIPDASLNFNQLRQNFARKGLNERDLVALSGAHTFGFAHCSQFSKRLYNYSRKAQTDPRMDPGFANSLKEACPLIGADPDLVEPFEPVTPFSFDNLYYQTLTSREALLNSDQELLSSKKTGQMVSAFANDQSAFFSMFAKSLQKMATIGVKTGQEGDVRLDCTRFNR